MKKKALKYGLFLCVLGLIVGVLLSVVNAITKPIIEKQEEEKVTTMLKEYNENLTWSGDIKEELNSSDSNILAIYAGSLNNEKVVYTYKHWLNPIVNSFIINPTTKERIANGFIEGKNNFVKAIKRIGFGYKDFDIFRAKILYANDNHRPFKIK